VNLNAEVMLNGMEKVITEFRCLNTAVKQLAVGQFLDMSMNQFKNSIPLFVELKNVALRDRHWRDLMAKTGLCLSV
jgi:dynein heavy chain